MEQEKLFYEEENEAKINALSALAETASSLSRAVNQIATYVPTQWVDNSEPSINATRLMHIENGIRDATNALNNAIDAVTANSTAINKINSDFIKQTISTNIVDFATSFTGKTALIYYNGNDYSWLPNQDPNYRYGTFILECTPTSKKITAFSWNGKGMATKVYGNNEWQDWIMWVSNSNLAKTKFIEFRNSEFFNNPLALLKNKWEELSVDFTYLVRLVCGNTYLAIVLKFTDHTYGSVFIIGYGLTEPIYANLNNGVWTDKTLAIK